MKHWLSTCTLKIARMAVSRVGNPDSLCNSLPEGTQTISIQQLLFFGQCNSFLNHNSPHEVRLRWCSVLIQYFGFRLWLHVHQYCTIVWLTIGVRVKLTDHRLAPHSLTARCCMRRRKHHKEYPQANTLVCIWLAEKKKTRNQTQMKPREKLPSPTRSLNLWSLFLMTITLPLCYMYRTRQTTQQDINDTSTSLQAHDNSGSIEIPSLAVLSLSKRTN